jgi:hypothetical protein
MTGETRIVVIGSGAQETAPEEILLSAEYEAPPALEDTWEEEAPVPRRDWAAILLPTLAFSAILVWSGLFGWENRAAILAGGSLDQWLNWIGEWSMPVLLVCVAWLLLMRSSTREVRRFGDAARLLGDESARLENRLTAINRELSLAREFIASQARDLESLGRMATERISQHADKLDGLIKDNGARLSTIGNVSASALDNMEKLRGQLPVIASSAKDVTNNIANAGRAAHGQLEDLIVGFNRLNEFGQASERQIAALRATVDGALGEFTRQAEQLDAITSARFAELTERGAEFRNQLDSAEVEALATIRTRASALVDELGQVRQTLDGHEAESLTSLRARLTAVRDEGAAVTRALRDGESQAIDAWRRAVVQLESDLSAAIEQVGEIDTKAMESARSRLNALAVEAAAVDTRLTERNRLFDEEVAQRHVNADSQNEKFMLGMTGQLAKLDQEISTRRAEQEDFSRRLITHSETISAQLTGFAERMETVAAHGSEAEATIAVSLTTLAEHLTASRQALAGTDTAIAGLTDNSVRLLELIQASVQHSSVELPAAMTGSEAKLVELEARAAALRDTVTDAEGRGEALSNYVISSHSELVATMGELDGLHSELDKRAAGHAASLDEIHQSLERAQNESASLAERSQAELRGAIEALTGSARDAVSGIEQIGAASVHALAERLGEESGAAIERAMRARTTEAVGQLEQAASHAAGVSREAAIQLRDQLTKVNELAGNLERRIAHARERAEEQVDNDFARRVALITESLNSNAIDIAKAMSSEVTDTAWASYLRGDRGVFTRRAVRLLDAAEAKSVAQIYEKDTEFRDHVSRYIHDFEGMLRQLLSTRDGHALGVTLLSSDMGKLYVALAQAIERLRN